MGLLYHTNVIRAVADTERDPWTVVFGKFDNHHFLGGAYSATYTGRGDKAKFKEVGSQFRFAV
jgi:hypothetical protein